MGIGGIIPCSETGNGCVSSVIAARDVWSGTLCCTVMFACLDRCKSSIRTKLRKFVDFGKLRSVSGTRAANRDRTTDLNPARCLVQVVEKQRDSVAARTLDIPKSRISRQVKSLEEALGARCLNQDSRLMSLTEADAAAFRHAKIAQACMEAAEAAVRRDKIALEGTVTLSCSVGVAQFALSRVLPRFLAENPRVPLRLQASDGFVRRWHRLGHSGTCPVAARLRFDPAALHRRPVASLRRPRAGVT